MRVLSLVCVPVSVLVLACVCAPSYTHTKRSARQESVPIFRLLFHEDEVVSEARWEWITRSRPAMVSYTLTTFALSRTGLMCFWLDASAWTVYQINRNIRTLYSTGVERSGRKLLSTHPLDLLTLQIKRNPRICQLCSARREN
jgi:hypothetical protein